MSLLNDDYIPATLLRDVPDDRREEVHAELLSLWHHSVREYFDVALLRRTHFNQKTHQAGCRGPFCTAAMRQYSRERRGDGVSARYELEERALAIYWDRIELYVENNRKELQRELLEAIPDPS